MEAKDNPASAAAVEPKKRTREGQNALVIPSTAVVTLFRAIEPLWVLAAAAWVNLSYLLQMGALLTWAGLALAFLPFFLRLMAWGYCGVRTPFDLPVAITVAGGLVGLWVSFIFDLSLGAFQSLLAAILLYYSIANYYRPASLMKWGLPLFALAITGATFFAFSQGPLPSNSLMESTSWIAQLLTSISEPPPSDYYRHYLALRPSHGLALTLLIAAALGAGFAAFSKRLWLKLLSGFSSAFFLAIMVLFTSGSIARLFTWESIRGRLPLWQDTVRMLEAHPLSGLGLGSWTYLHNGGSMGDFPTHPHNAYLQLYSDAGLLGALALLTTMVIAVKLGWGILRSSRGNPWYGLGVGALLASLLSGLVGFTESAPAGIPVMGTEAYSYVVSPIPWILLSLLVVAHRLLKQSSATEGNL